MKRLALASVLLLAISVASSARQEWPRRPTAAAPATQSLPVESLITGLGSSAAAQPPDLRPPQEVSEPRTLIALGCALLAGALAARRRLRARPRQ